MASPFYLFRKYQKAFLVVAGVLAMFIFVVADPLMSWLQSSSGGGGSRNAKTVVTTWDGGSMNLRQLDMLSQRRFKISEFLRNLVGQAAGMIEQEGGTALPPNLPDFRLQDNNPRSVQVGCVTTRVLAELAEKSDISISDDVINHYLREWGLRRMGDAEMAQILGRVGLNDKTLFAGLRELLMGNFYINSYSLATLGIMPEERWQDWKRINDRIALQAALLPAEKFLAEVPEPSEAELNQFYALNKDRIGGSFHRVMNVTLPSPDPGFREPRRVKLQYLLASVDDWTQKLSDSVTEVEIADYYERNKRAQFVQMSTSTSAEGLFDDDTEPTTETPAEENKTPAESSEETPTEETPTEETPIEEAPAEENPTSEGQPAEDESSQLPRKSPFRLAALQTEEEEEEEEEEPAAETEAEAEETADAETADTETADTETEEPVKYVPLEEVREQIRRSLARDKAVVELQKIVDRVYGKLQSAYNPYGFKIVSARTEEKELPAPPVELSDFVAIARETGLTSEETVLLSDRDLADTFVGKSLDAQSRREFVVQAMFGDQELYEPYRSTDLDGNSYIVCKVEDVASSVPEFDAVRDAVLAAWKEQEAAKLALAKAEELAEQAKSGGDTVATVARGAGYETVTTDMFSWLSFGTTPQEMQRGARLGEAPPLEAVDDQFMTQAFELKPDQKIALLNHDHSSAYVLQLDRREQAEADMRQQFLAEANAWYGGRAMTRSRQQGAYFGLIRELTDRIGLDREKLEEFLSKDKQ